MNPKNLLKLIKHDEDGEKIIVGFKAGDGTEYTISYYLDDDGDKQLTHNDGYCAGTSDLTCDYPDNQDYASDDDLNEILNSL